MLAHKYSALVGRVENRFLKFFCCCRVAGLLTSQSLQSTCNYFCSAIAQLADFTASEWSTRHRHPVGQPKKPITAQHKLVQPVQANRVGLIIQHTAS